MKKTAVSLLIAALLTLILLYILGGAGLIVEGLTKAGRTFLQAILLIIVAFFVIGQLQMLVSSEMIKTWLVRFSGSKGIVLSSIAGGLFPGGPYILYPFLAGFKGKGIPFYLIFSFVTGKHNYDFTRLPLEISLITPGLALLRNIITIPIPIIMGLLSLRFFPHGLKGISWEGDEQL